MHLSKDMFITNSPEVMLPATRGAEVLYGNVIKPLVGNIKAKAQQSTGTSQPFQKQSEGFSAAAPSSFERE